MENETFKIPEIITVDWLRETINELNNKLEIIINSNKELSRLLAEKQITYEVYREKIDNHSNEMRDLRSKIETFERVLEAFAYDRIMQDPEAIDKLYQGYKENLERSLSEQKTKKEELEQELSMLENELTMSKYVSVSTENLKIADGYQKGQFSCVTDGQINADIENNSTVFKAAQDAMNGSDPTNGALYFYNPSKTKSKWLFSLPVIATIGEHKFSLGGEKT